MSPSLALGYLVYTASFSCLSPELYLVRVLTWTVGTGSCIRGAGSYMVAVSELLWSRNPSPDLPFPTMTLSRAEWVYLIDKAWDLPTYRFVQVKRSNTANMEALLLVRKCRGHS